MRASWSLALILNAYPVVSSIIPSDERCVTAIYTAYGYITFAGSPSVGFWDTRCQNALKVTSIYASTQVHCSDSEQAAGISQLAALCRQIPHLDLIPRDQLAINLTTDAIQRMRTVDYQELPGNVPVDAPILLSSSHYDRTFRTIVGSRPLSSPHVLLIAMDVRMPGNLRHGPIWYTGKSGSSYPARTLPKDYLTKKASPATGFGPAS